MKAKIQRLASPYAATENRPLKALSASPPPRLKICSEIRRKVQIISNDFKEALLGSVCAVLHPERHIAVSRTAPTPTIRTPSHETNHVGSHSRTRPTTTDRVASKRPSRIGDPALTFAGCSMLKASMDFIIYPIYPRTFPIPAVILLHQPPGYFPELFAAGRILGELIHCSCQIANDLRGGNCGDLDAGFFSYLHTRTPKVQADDRATSSHRFHANPTTRIMKAGMDQDITLHQVFQNSRSWHPAKEMHTLRHTKCPSQPF